MSGASTETLLLLFSAGDNLYAADAEPIVEVVPSVPLKTVPHAPKAFSGILNLSGTPVPVIDFCELVVGRPSHASLHTRIILVSNPNPNDSFKILGIIAEKVTETTTLDLKLFIDSGIAINDLPFLRGVLNTPLETLQLVSIHDLFNVAREIAAHAEI